MEGCVDAYLDKKAFHNLPKVPPSPAEGFGQEVILVSYAEGDVIGTPGYDDNGLRPNTEHAHYAQHQKA